MQNTDFLMFSLSNNSVTITQYVYCILYKYIPWKQAKSRPIQSATATDYNRLHTNKRRDIILHCISTQGSYMKNMYLRIRDTHKLRTCLTKLYRRKNMYVYTVAGVVE